MAHTYTLSSSGIGMVDTSVGVVSWGPIPEPSLKGGMRLHQQGGAFLKDGSLLQLSVVYWGPLEAGKSSHRP